jgi:hypothetical protein
MAANFDEEQLVDQAVSLMHEAVAGCAEGAGHFLISADVSRLRPYLKYRNALTTALSILDAVRDQDLKAARSRQLAAEAHIKDAKRCFDQIEKTETELRKKKAAAYFSALENSSLN